MIFHLLKSYQNQSQTANFGKKPPQVIQLV